MLLSFRQINQSSLNFDELCLQEMKRVLAEVCFKRLRKFQVFENGFDRPTTLLPGLVGVFLTCICVPDVLIALLYM